MWTEPLMTQRSSQAHQPKSLVDTPCDVKRLPGRARPKRLRSACPILLLPLSVVLLSSILGLVERSHAQVTPSGSGSLGTMVTPGPMYEITGGTRPGGGANLFHSFGEFSLLVGETALFKDPAPPPTSNIIGRVTDGLPSNIYGAIDSATYYPGANLFLINPAGVLFGATATLNVGGSVNISTADYLRLADGARFEAIPGAQDALLSSAPVAAYGFLGPAVGPITFEGANFSMPAGQSLTAVGGVISVTSDPVSGAPALLTAPSGQVRLASVASVAGPGELLESNLQSVPNFNGVSFEDSFTGVGTLALEQGTIRVQDGQLVMDTSIMFASTVPGAAQAAEILISGKSIQLDNGFGLASITVDDPGPNITLSGEHVSLSGGSVILSDTSGAGQGGNVTISASNTFSITGADQFGNASNITTSASGSAAGGAVMVTGSPTKPDVLIDRGYITTGTGADGNAGPISVDARNVTVSNGGAILSTGANGSSGTISVAADVVTISGQFDPVTPSIIETLNGASGPTGDIAVNVRQFSLADGARVSTDALGLAGGNITITATESATVSGGSKIRVGVLGTSGGTLTMSSQTVTLNNGILQTLTVGVGNAGTIMVNAGSVSMSNGSLMNSNSTGTGDAGNITITAGQQVNLFDSSITTQALLASGGNVTIKAGELVRLNNSQINTSVAGGPTTAGGDIMIDPPFVVLQNNSQILAQAFAGLGGNITIVAGGLFVDPTSTISASSQLGISGVINVQSPVFFLSGTLVPLPKNPVQAASLLQQRCAARMQGSGASNFVQRGRDGLPPEPGGWLTSPMLAAASPATPQIGQAEPSPAVASHEGPLTRLASANLSSGCGLELVLAQ